LQGRRDLNPQPLVLETSALPIELRPSANRYHSTSDQTRVFERRSTVEPVHATSATPDPRTYSESAPKLARTSQDTHPERRWIRLGTPVDTHPERRRNSLGTPVKGPLGAPPGADPDSSEHHYGGQADQTSQASFGGDPSTPAQRSGHHCCGLRQRAKCATNGAVLFKLGPARGTASEVASEGQVNHRSSIGGTNEAATVPSAFTGHTQGFVGLALANRRAG
jgi:hypothetical protein